MTPSVTVIGTILMDCKGFSHQPYHPDGRNLGSVRFVHGGVGRNVAENLARLRMPVSMASTVNADGNGKAIVDHLRECGVRTEYIVPVPEKGMGIWLAILDENGNLAGSISDMPDLGVLTALIEEEGERMLAASSHLVLVLDLNETLTKKALQIAKKLGKPVYGLPSNFSVVGRHPEVLEGLDCFVCNEFEAERLFACPPLAGLPREEQLSQLRRFVHSRSLHAMVVTLGAGGSVYCDSRSGDIGYHPAHPVRLVDSSGAGDAFFSGTVMGLVGGASLKDAVSAGTRIAGWTIESPENCCRSLSSLAEQDPFVRALMNEKTDAFE